MIRIADVDATDTHDLRRLVLRDGRPDAEVVFDGDDHPATIHVAAITGDTSPIGVATLLSHPTSLRMNAAQPFQLRGMAVHPERQGQGIGRLLIEGAIDRLRRIDADVLWANARDEALGFYRSVGMEVIGAGFVTETGRPHHAVVLDLRPGDSRQYLSPGSNK